MRERERKREGERAREKEERRHFLHNERGRKDEKKRRGGFLGVLIWDEDRWADMTVCVDLGPHP